MKIAFTRLADGTAEEYAYLEEFDRHLNRDMVADVLDLFRSTDRETGYPVSPMRHALQTATRAFREGAEDEMVVAALLHDIGDRISPHNHARVAAELLRPFVKPRTHWVVAHHAIFQGYFFWHHIGKDRNARERYRGHPYFENCVQFVERWDQVSFDPAYDTMQEVDFVPMLERVFGREPFAMWRSEHEQD
jgi:predicted HD phosphohydrolase